MSARYILLAISLALLIIGCGGRRTTPVLPDNTAAVRSIGAFPDVTGGTTVTIGETALTTGAGFGVLGNFTQVPAGTHAATFFRTATPQDMLATAQQNFMPGNFYSVIGFGPAGQRQALVLQDLRQLQQPGTVSYRIVNAFSAETAVDVYIVPTGVTDLPVNPTISNLAYGAVSARQNVGITGATLNRNIFVTAAGERTPLVEGNMSLGNRGVFTLIVADPEQGANVPNVFLLNELEPLP
jgi:hypothetical protein